MLRPISLIKHMYIEVKKPYTEQFVDCIGQKLTVFIDFLSTLY